MEYTKAKKLIDNGTFLIDFAGKNPEKVFTAAETAKLIDARPGVARALLAGLAREGVLFRTERGRYKASQEAQAPTRTRKRPRRAAASPEATTPAPRRSVVMPEELVQAVARTLLADCALSAVQDRDAYVATLNDMHNGLTVATNRSAALAIMDVVGKWERTHRAP